MMICLLVAFAVALAFGGEAGKDRLGDSVISEKSSDAFFNRLDNNDNGHVSVEEFKKFIRDTGGNAMDENSEIQSAIANVLISLDDNADEIIKKTDLAQFWMRQASLLSVEEVADWAEHAMHMPREVVDIFIKNAVTGYDFPELLDNDGELIESQLGITQRNLKRRLIRGMLMRFSAMGKLPSPPENFNARSLGRSEVKISWDKMPTKNVNFPVHKYVVQRLEPPPKFKLTNSIAPPVSSWVTIYSGTGVETVDHLYGLNDETHRVYRICAWNAIGRSEFVTTELMLPLDFLGSIDGNIITLDGSSYASKAHWIFSAVFFLLLFMIYYLVKPIDSNVVELDDSSDIASGSYLKRVLKWSFLMKRSASIGHSKTTSNDNVTESTEHQAPEVNAQPEDIAESSCDENNLSSSGALPKSKAGWGFVRDRVKNKHFSKLFKGGRNGIPPCAPPSPGQVDGATMRTNGIAVARVPSTSSNALPGIDRNDIFDEIPPSVNTMYSPKADEKSFETPVPPGLLPRVQSWGDESPPTEKKEKNGTISSLFRKKSPNSSSENLNGLAEIGNGRISPTIREKDDICYNCNNPVFLLKKHRCCQCKKIFCRNCSSKITHAFTLCNKVPGDCRCINCKHH